MRKILRDEMENHVRAHLPEEACGMLGGRGESVELVAPVANQARSAVRYYMDPREMLAAFELFHKLNIELVATFHSHPAGPAVPSETDVREFYYPGTAMLIWSPLAAMDWQVRAFMIEMGTF
ncbi:MAG: M67 family metallopeptidase, partial [Chloroflexota bacterium]